MKTRAAVAGTILLLAVYATAALQSRTTPKTGSSTSTASTTTSSSTSTSTGGIAVGSTLPPVMPEIVYRGYECGRDALGNLVPVATPVDGLPAPTAVAAGFLHSLALDEQGHVWAWGDNTFGQLGQPATVLSSRAPLMLSSDRTFVAIAAGWFHSVAIDSDRGVWTWGNNSSGQLGTGAFGPIAVSTPVRCMTNARAVSAGLAHTLALTPEGNLYAWGNNFMGQIGANECIDLLTFLRCAGTLPSAPPSDPRALWNWLRDYLLEIAEEARRLVALSPTLVREGVREIAAGALHSLAVLTNSTVLAWGSDVCGESGDGRVLVFATAPVQSLMVSGLGIEPIANAIAVGGGMFSSAVLRSDGTVVTFGYNAEGQLGYGYTTPTSPIGFRVPGLSGVRTISMGVGHSVVCLADGRVRGWGLNSYGQLGDGSVTPFTAAPSLVLGIACAQSAAAGGVQSLIVAP